MKTIMLVFGTRPEAIKMCPLVKEFQKRTEKFKTTMCVTGQHREMLDQVLRIFDVTEHWLPRHLPTILPQIKDGAICVACSIVASRICKDYPQISSIPTNRLAFPLRR